MALRRGGSAPVKTEPAAPAQEAPAQAETGTPPWAVAGCNACKGKGINSKGAPCRACDVVSGRTGGSTVSQFKVWTDDQGNLCWTAADGSAPTHPVQAPAPKPKKPAQSIPKIPDSPETRHAAEVPPEAPKKARKKRKKAEEASVSTPAPKADGFTLYVGCVPLGEDYLDMASLLANEGAELAQAHGSESFYDVGAFDRRDQLAKHAATVAKALGNVSLVVLETTTDIRDYLVALKPHAARVVVGVR